MTSTHASSNSVTNDINDSRFLYLKEITVDFTRTRPNCKLQIKLRDEMKTWYESKVFGETETLQWNCEIYIKSPSMAMVQLQSSGNTLRRAWTAKLQLDFGSTDFRENDTAHQSDANHGITIKLTFGVSGNCVNVARLLANKAVSALSTKISMLEKMDKVLGYFDLVLKFGSVGFEAHPFACAAAAGLDAVFKRFQEIPTCHCEFVAIMEDIVSILPLLESLHKRVEDEAVQNVLKLFVDIVERLSRDLDHYSSKPLFNFLLINWYKSKQNELKEFNSRLTRLCLTLNIGITSEIHRHQLSEEEEKVLRQLRPPENSSFDVKRCCLEGTRVEVLRRINEWIRSTDSNEQLYWIHGVAGCGKSSVAASVATELDSRRVLSGSFFCSRDIPGRRSSARLVHALLYFLARASSPFKHSLLQLLKEDPDFIEKPFSTQVKSLLSRFLVGLHLDRTQSAPIIVVLDALDECEEKGEVASFVVGIIKLVPSLKIIVTSRPVPHIREALERHGRLASCDLFEVDSYGDILRFTHDGFQSNKELPHDFPEDQIVALVRKSSGHFIWITTILKHVSSQLRQKRGVLSRILASTSDGSSERKLDTLYRQVLDDVSEKSDDRLGTIRLLIGFVFVTSRNRPLPVKALHALIPSEFELEELIETLQKLGSVITVEPQTGVIRTCHPSFLDFISSQERAGDYWLESSVLDMKMAEGCLDILVSGLKFNICNLETSYLPNGKVRDLAERIRKFIPHELQYSCLYWLDHLSRARVDEPCEASIQRKLRDAFCTTKSLYWLEVLSLMSELKKATSILRDLPRLVKTIHADEVLRDVTTDLYRFVMAFHEPIAISAPHVYISALPWAPSKSVIAEPQHRKFSSGQLVLEGLEERWPAALRTLSADSGVYSIAYSPDGRHVASGSLDNIIHIWDAGTGVSIGESLQGHESSVLSVGYSPEGRRIVSGSKDYTIRIWDAESGASVCGPIRGHESWVISVRYSPDGRHIASGSSDKTIRIWDAETGSPVTKPLRGHRDSVRSVGYSPDGRRIVSGSGDKTIRIWDAKTGVSISKPFRGHEQLVNSVAYSPDGRCIISGCGDGTIRIWNAETGDPIGEPLRGHESWVNSVGYSPDGRWIISGSYDETVRIWNAQTGTPHCEPLRGHGDYISSVGYSPDGRHIISGSHDKTIRIWDAEAGAPITEPRRGHKDSVRSVGYSPDGRRIVSGSEDRTIRIWDAGTGAPIAGPLQGHEDLIRSVGYSPDGRHIVSGSDDKTIRIWDAETGAPISGPLRGHRDSVRSVEYSPDGRRIVSGSSDWTVRIWDAETCFPIGGPLRGHEEQVHCVKYSPDGRCIVSGSSDKTIRIWDAQTSALISGPLRGHHDSVYSIDYSPDGRYIVSGSYDETIRIWDSESGASVGEPLCGHEGSVNSVGYSPDGCCIVSGSHDGTIVIWNAEAHVAIGEPLRGHEGWIISVVFSPDGHRIASGSLDKIIRIWDTNRHDFARGLYECKGGRIRFSQDGKYVVSDADDGCPLLRIPPSIPPDGWIRTSDGALLLWVPHQYRNGICDMSLYTLPRNASGRRVRIDWSRLSHGASWTSVKIQD